ncbi:MAG: SH3 domain-containing protein [Chloroflexi bacterium]|nr:SH3 domain-containing protein [Chloroflexota bacterium]
MTNSTFLKFIPFPILLFAVLACGVTGTPVPTPDTLGTVVAETLTSMPVIPTQTVATPDQAIFSPIPPLPSSTPEAVGVRYVYTQAQNVNLRVNPGRLFKVSRVLAQGTRLQLLGVAPGGQWLNVVNDEGVIGWVGVDFVSGGFDGPPPPVVTPKDVLVVTGTVLDANGVPVNGIGFAVEQGGQRDDASTDETGTFYAFLPTKFPGAWTVSFVSVACTSESPDDKCRCTGDACATLEPKTVTVMVPMSAPISFVWK